jgi:hypothetical protein
MRWILSFQVKKRAEGSLIEEGLGARKCKKKSIFSKD